MCTEDKDLPRVTIVTPSFNQGKYLEATILSVLNQDYPNIEYIVIDGGSTDGSVDVIKRYQNRLAYSISEPDRGQSHAINKGFEHATGDIFNWLNSDDLLMPSAVKIAVHYLMKKTDVGMVYGDRIIIDIKGNFLDLIQSPSFNPKAMLYNLRIPQETVFFRRRFWDELKGVDEALNYCMDYDLWIRLNKVTRIYHIPFVLGAYRTHPSAKSTKGYNHQGLLGRKELDKVMFRHFSKRRNKTMIKVHRKLNLWLLNYERKSKWRKNEVADIRRFITGESMPVH